MAFFSRCWRWGARAVTCLLSDVGYAFCRQSLLDLSWIELRNSRSCWCNCGCNHTCQMNPRYIDSFKTSVAYIHLFSWPHGVFSISAEMLLLVLMIPIQFFLFEILLAIPWNPFIFSRFSAVLYFFLYFLKIPNWYTLIWQKWILVLEHLTCGEIEGFKHSLSFARATS